jgi:cell wall-associated NlpC family hydrolase
MIEDGAMNRRRVLALAAALAAGSALERENFELTEAAKKKKKKKSGNKKKSKKKSKTSQSSGGSGKEIVRTAKKYLGAKYVWAGASPKGFDCSGFTWYVYNQAAGMDIGRAVKDQYRQGNSVSKGSWQAGDIVFFKNTFEKGLSHCGIFISGSDFIHAENEDTGVVISSLDSGYYKDHYAGARRLL